MGRSPILIFKFSDLHTRTHTLRVAQCSSMLRCMIDKYKSQSTNSDLLAGGGSWLPPCVLPAEMRDALTSLATTSKEGVDPRDRELRLPPEIIRAVIARGLEAIGQVIAAPPAERAERVPSTRTTEGDVQAGSGQHSCNCSDCRERRGTVTDVIKELANRMEEECSRPEVGSIPIGSTERAREEGSTANRPPPTVGHRQTWRGEDGDGACSCGFEWSACAPACPELSKQQTAASSQQPIPPYDARYEGKPGDVMVFYAGIGISPAAASRLRYLTLAAYKPAADPKQADNDEAARATFRRVIAIGLSAIDVLERRDTAFTREQATNAEKAVSLLAELRASMTDCKPFWTPEAEAQRAAAKLHSTPDIGGVESTTRDGGPAFYRPADAPISPTEQMNAKARQLGMPTMHAQMRQYAAECDARDKAAGIQPDSDPNPTMFEHQSLGKTVSSIEKRLNALVAWAHEAQSQLESLRQHSK